MRKLTAVMKGVCGLIAMPGSQKAQHSAKHRLFCDRRVWVKRRYRAQGAMVHLLTRRTARCWWTCGSSLQLTIISKSDTIAPLEHRQDDRSDSGSGSCGEIQQHSRATQKFQTGAVTEMVTRWNRSNGRFVHFWDGKEPGARRWTFWCGWESCFFRSQEKILSSTRKFTF